MTTPTPPVTPFDTGNTLLAEQPAQLLTTVIGTPAGQRLFVTVRTPSATQTVLLKGPDARTWAAALTKAADSMSASGLVVANGTVLGSTARSPQP